jgi:hypothetical protein
VGVAILGKVESFSANTLELAIRILLEVLGRVRRLAISYMCTHGCAGFAPPVGSPSFGLIRLCVVGFGLFLVSGYKSCSEYRYATGANDAIARVTRIHQEPARRNRPALWTVSYKFQNADTGELQRGNFRVREADIRQHTVGDEIAIEYHGASQVDSRLKGDNDMPWVYAFLGSLAFCVGATAILSWQSVRAERLDRKRGRSPARATARKR